jgi:hypothetical protein
MSFTYNPGNPDPITYIRLLVADTDSTNPVFQDSEVTMALTQESSQALFISAQAISSGISVSPPIPQVFSYWRSAALLLDSLAANKSRLAAINNLLDVKISAEKAAQELRATAKEYRERENNAGHFAIAEMVHDIFSARERVWKQLLRLYAG